MVVSQKMNNFSNEVVDFLGMHPDRVRRLSNEARREINAPPPEEIYLEMLRQALVDGVIHEEEEALLRTVQIAFDIDSETHEQMLREALEQPYVSPELEAYSSVLKTAMIDGIITNDESACSKHCGENRYFGQEHAMLLAELQDKRGIIMGMSDDDVKIHDALKKLERVEEHQTCESLLVGTS